MTIKGQQLCKTVGRAGSSQYEFHLALHLSTTLCTAQQKLSIGVNVVCKGSPSRMRRVLLISLGITILPKSSTLLTMPVAFIYLSPFTIHLAGDRRSPLQILTNLFVGANCVRPSTIILQITMLLFVNGEDLYCTNTKTNLPLFQ